MWDLLSCNLGACEDLRGLDFIRIGSRDSHRDILGLRCARHRRSCWPTKAASSFRHDMLAFGSADNICRSYCTPAGIVQRVFILPGIRWLYVLSRCCWDVSSSGVEDLRAGEQGAARA